METMTAFRMLEWGHAPEFVEMPIPSPGSGEVLVEVAAVGLCHSDVHYFHATEGTYGFPVPFTLGHEIAGRVAMTNAPSSPVAVGDPVAVAAGPRCGTCLPCLRGEDNLCIHRRSGRGWGQDGGLGRYVVVAARELVPLTTLDPAKAAPLSDAGVTAYHAVRKVAPRLVGGTTAVVIGVGGLGSFAVQFLHQLTGAHVVALDTHEHRLRAAAKLGADSAVMQADVDELVEERTTGQGADVVMDFVGISETMEFALRSTRAGGAIAILGAAGGTATIGWGRLPTDCDLFIPMGGTTAELHDVVAFAESGRITVDIERFAFDDVATAYARVEAGDVSGRAVVDVT